MVLVADEREIVAEGHNEPLYVLDDFLLHNTLVNIFFVTLSDFLNIDEIKHIFILEHHDSFSGLPCVRYCLGEIVGNQCLMVEFVIFYCLYERINRKVLLSATMNIVISLFNIRRAL